MDENQKEALASPSDHFIESKGKGGVSGYTKEQADAKFRDIHYVLIGVVVILLVMVATLLIMGATLIIDSLHLNSATYKEYSEKTDTLNLLRDTNRELLKQNQENQEFILEQQTQVLKLLNQ